MDRVGETTWSAKVTELWTKRNGILIPVVMNHEAVELTWRGNKIAVIKPILLSDIDNHMNIRTKWAAEHNVGLRPVAG